MGKFPDHPLPPIVLTWAPLEVTFGLSFFGLLAGFSGEEGRPEVGGHVLFLDCLVRNLATLLCGTIGGYACAKGLSHIKHDPQSRSANFFTGSSVEAFLILMGVGFAALGTSEIVPNGIIDGSMMFNPELFVIVIGSSFAYFADYEVLHGVEVYVAGVWVFGSIILFSMLGSRTELIIFKTLPTVLPMMLVGLLFRFIGICVTFSISRLGRRSRGLWGMRDVLFCFLCTLPRASVQGALGSWPLQHRFFSNDPNNDTPRELISKAARLYIICFTCWGSILLEVLGPRLLRSTMGERLPTSGVPFDDARVSSISSEEDDELLGIRDEPERWFSWFVDLVGDRGDRYDSFELKRTIHKDETA